MKKIKDLFKESDINTIELNDKYYLWLEKLDYDYEEQVLVELHEIVERLPNGDFISDMVETLNTPWNLKTPLSEITFDNVKKYAYYII